MVNAASSPNTTTHAKHTGAARRIAVGTKGGACEAAFRSALFSLVVGLVACGATSDRTKSKGVSSPSTADGYTNFADDGVAPQPITLEANWPLVRVKVNGAEHTFLLDTGAQATVLDLNAFPDLGSAGTNIAVNLEVFEREFAQQRVVTINFEAPGWFGIDGIIGADILSHYVFTVDYQGQQAWLREDPEAALAGFEPGKIVSTSIHTLTTGDLGWKEVEVDLESVRALMLVDTGASVTLVSTQLLDQLASDGRPRVTGGVLSSGIPTIHTRVHTASIGTHDTRVENLPLIAISYDTPPYDHGVLGTTFFRHFLTTIDGPGNRLVLSRYKDDSHIDPNEFVGLGFQLRFEGGHFLVRGIVSGGPADAALQIGDEVLSIGELLLTDASRRSLQGVLTGYAPGEVALVNVVRDEDEFQLELVAKSLLPSIVVAR